MSIARSGFAAAVPRNKFYVCGGSDIADNMLNSVESFDLNRNLWEVSPPMISERDKAQAADISGRLYICGGSNHYVFQLCGTFRPRT